jgi:hypothetical protein
MTRPFTIRPAAVAALLGDQFRRLWWRALNAQIAVFATAAIVYASLLHAGPLDPQAGRTLHFVLLWIVFAAASGAALTAVGSPSQFYLLPVSNGLIAAVMLLPAILSAGMTYAVTALAVNGMFAVGWPVAGPALFLGMTAGVMQAISLAAGPSHTGRLAGWSLAAILLEGWLRACYGGGRFLLPQATWPAVTTAELSFMALLIGISFLVNWAAISRDRRGDPALMSIVDMRPAMLMRGRSPTVSRFAGAGRAQFWFEWRQKGLIIPGLFAVFAGFMVVGYVFDQFDNREYELLHGCFGFGTGLAPIAAIVGLVVGHVDLAGANSECDSFLATRPATNAFLAGALLKTAAASLLVTWVLWCAAMLATTGWLYLHQGTEPVLDLWTLHGEFAAAFATLGDWYAALLFGAVLVAAWIPLSLAASLVLTGRPRLLVSVVAGSVPALLAGLFLASRAAEGQPGVPAAAWHFVIGSISMAATAWLFVAARRGGQIGASFSVKAATAWLAACAVGGCIYILVGPLNLSDLVLVGGVLALPLASLAAAPLALAWNRHR